MNGEVIQQGAQWPDALIAIAGIIFVMTVAVVVVWQVFSTARAKMSIERERAYRALAEATEANQRQLLEQQSTITADITQLRQSVTGLETLLKDVQ